MISFKEYLDFLKAELFTKLGEADDTTVLSTDKLDKVDEVCWFVCSRTYLARPDHVLCSNDVFKLWRVFNLHAEVDPDIEGELLYPIVIDQEEAHNILKHFVAASGKGHDSVELSSLKGN